MTPGSPARPGVGDSPADRGTPPGGQPGAAASVPAPLTLRSAPFGVLVTLRFRLWRNALTKGTPQERRRARTGFLATATMAAAVGYLSIGFFGPLVESARGRPELERILLLLPGFALFSAFWMLLLSAVTVGIQTFFLNQEFVLLLAAPLRPRTVFVAKFLEATAANAGIFVTIGGPMLLTFAYASDRLTLEFGARLLVVLVAFSALPTAAGLLVSFLLMRVLPAHRTRDLLAALGITVFAAIYIGVSVAIRHVSERAPMLPGTGRLAAILASPIARTGPWAWAGDALSGSADAASAWGLIALLCTAAAACVWLAALVAQWLHWRGWSQAQETPAAAPSTTVSPVGAGWERRLAALPGPTRAVLLKDLRTLRRDLRQLSMLLIPLAAVAVFIYNAAATPQFRGLPPLLFLQTLFLLLAPIALRLAMSAFVAESRAMWLVISAPGDPGRMLLGKFLYAYSLSLPLAGVSTALYAAALGMPALESAIGLGLVVCASAGFCGIGVGASAFFTDFGADNPRFAVSAGARIATFALQMVYLAILAAATLVAGMVIAVGGAMAAVIVPTAAVVILLVSVLFVIGPLSVAAVRLRRLEW